MATRILLTESQREELENQTLVFKYLAANVPVPPHLLFLITRPFLSSTFISSQHSRWNVYEMGMGMMGRKIDREPGRCRRTDGKKWRCSKQTSSPHSKYCDRHIHRGKNRSSLTKPLLPPPPKLSLSSALNLSPSSRVTRRRRSGYMDDDDVYESLKRREKHPDLNCFILGTGERPTLMIEEKLKQRQAQDYDDEEEEEEKSSKMVFKFIDEWPSSKSSSSSSVSTSLFI